MRKITNIILLLFILITFFLLLFAGDSFTVDWWKLLGCSCLPYIIVLFFNLIKKGQVVKDRIIFVTAFIVSVPGMFILIGSLFLSSDAQSPLVLLFLPGYQTTVSLFGGLIGLGLHQRVNDAQQAN